MGDPFSNAIYSESKCDGKPETSVGRTSIYGFQKEFFRLFSYIKWFAK